MAPLIKFLVPARRLNSAEQHLTALVRILGADVEEVEISPDDSSVSDTFVAQLLAAAGVICSADVLANLLRRYRSGAMDLSFFASRLHSLLIYGVDDCSSSSARLLFGGDPSATDPVSTPNAGREFCFSHEVIGVSRQFAGLSFTARRADRSVPLVTEVRPPVSARIRDELATPIINCDGTSFFAVLRRPESKVFLLASSDAIDVNAPAPSGELQPEDYPRLLPWLLFVRQAVNDRCWHNPSPKACLIIDDPPLWSRYGFLSFEALARSMCDSKFKTTIAFIPWNYSRSSAATTELFHRNASTLSLCVHGCDHTGGEFASTDLKVLRQKAHVALERMRLHTEATGLEWDPVMVFPQGLFSSAATVALRKEGYLAATNSGISSADQPMTNRVGDLLAPASTAYGGVPLFKRHYPNDLLPFALDLFLGRPVLIAEHHTYFRRGYDEVRDFAARLRAIEPRLTWTSVGNVVRSAVQRRVTDAGVELRAYTDQVSVDGPGLESGGRRLIIHDGDPSSVTNVTINSRPAKYSLADNHIEVALDGAGDQRVEVRRRASAPVSAATPSLSSSAKVAIRRYLSELRDNASVAKARLEGALTARR